jgi:electron transport protein HydN
MSVQQTSFVLADAGKCTGCRACEVACFAGHSAAQGKTIGTITTPVTPRLYLARGEGVCMPIQCHHCEGAPCLRSCLTGAIERKDGTVVINERKCIGCRNCAIACPFGAIEVFTKDELGVAGKVTPKIVFKCDLCIDNKEPQCVKVCPNEAIRLVNPEDEILEKRVNAINAFEAFTAPAAATAASATAEGGK